MIEVEGVPRVHYHHGPVEIRVAADGESLGLIFIEGPDAHVYLMTKAEGEAVEHGVAKARTGLQVATSLPTAAAGRML